MTLSTVRPWRRSVPSWVAACLLPIGLVALLAVPTASAQTPTPTPSSSADDDESIRWTVKPSGPERPDGRKTIELTLSPGETITEHLAVKNLGQVKARFGLTAADGYRNRKGRFDMLTADQESVAAGTWIDIPSEVSVGAGKTEVIPFTITVPPTATPGDYLAGVAAGIATQGDQGLVVMNRMGFRISINVSGDVVAEAELEITGVEYQTSWNPFSPGRAEVSYRLRNTGNVRLAATGEAAFSGLFGMLRATVPLDIPEIEPGGERSDTVAVEDVWPAFWATVSVQLDPVRIGEADTEPTSPLAAANGSWALPLPQLLALVVLAGLALAGRGFLRLRRTRFANKVERAVAARLDQESEDGRPTVTGPRANTATDRTAGEPPAQPPRRANPSQPRRARPED